MLIGYARVSSKEQDNSAQITALKKAGCETIFHEKISSGRWERPQLQRMIDHLRKGDIVVVWKLDRLSRSLKDLLYLMEKLQGIGAAFKSLTEAIDTTTPGGRMMMQIVGSFAEFERAMLRERTCSGLAAARKMGRIGGRPPKFNEIQRKEIIKLVKKKNRSIAEVAALFGANKSTIWRIVQQA